MWLLSLGALCAFFALGSLFFQDAHALNLQLCLCRSRGRGSLAAGSGSRNLPHVPQILVKDAQGQVVNAQFSKLHRSGGSRACRELHFNPEQACTLEVLDCNGDSHVLPIRGTLMGTPTWHTRMTNGIFTLKIHSGKGGRGGARATGRGGDGDNDIHSMDLASPSSSMEEEEELEDPQQQPLRLATPHSPTQDPEDESVFAIASSAVMLLVLWLVDMPEFLFAAGGAF